MNPSAPLEYRQQRRDTDLRDDLEPLVRLAIREDLDRGIDLTTAATVPLELEASARIVPRDAGVAAGVDLIEWIVATTGAKIDTEVHVVDGSDFAAMQCLATLRGNARDLLTCERTILNFLGRLCGIATHTRRFVQAITGTRARVYDTRKTTPGWRRLEKYAVQCGGGHNHRSGLYDAVLIKDNHLASHYAMNGELLSPAAAVEAARRFLAAHQPAGETIIVEVEVDSLEQLADALRATPDIVLLDNMSLDQLREAVAIRDAATFATEGRRVELEASGGVKLSSIRSIAETGVDRISAGALTHSAINLDLGLDWSFG